MRTQDTYDLLVNELESYLGNHSLEHLQAVSFKAMCDKRIVFSVHVALLNFLTLSE